MHQAPHMVRIVANPEARVDGVRQPRRAPAFGFIAKGAGTQSENLDHFRLLGGCQTAGPPRRFALAKTLQAVALEGSAPARRSGPADTELAGDPGLRHAPQQFPGAFQTPMFHFIAIQCNRSGSVHSLARILARAFLLYLRTFSL